MNKLFSVVLLLFLLFSVGLHAFNLRKVGNKGMSGSMVNSVYQDKQGLIWLGTSIGICTYNGESVVPLPSFKGVSKVSGTVNGEIFAETLYGLRCLRGKSDSIKTFGMFNNVSFSASDSKGNIFIVQGNGSVYYKPNGQSSFDNILIQGLISDNIKTFFIDRADVLHIISEDGNLRNFSISYNNNVISLEEKKSIKIASKVLFCFLDKDNVYIVDGEYKLSGLVLPSYKISSVVDLASFLADKGKITSAIIFRKEFYFGTEMGFFAIRENKAVKIPINKEVTYLLKDRFQDLIWIGTAGDGVYTYSFDPYTIKTNVFLDFLPSISKPTTAIYYDQQRTLWLGTEGDGIVRIPNYDPYKEIIDISTVTVNDGLNDNTVYSIAKSRQGFWIGCKSGLAFYSSKNGTVSKVKTDGTPSLRNIRAICEQDSILWIACYGQGVAKAKIIHKNGNSEIENIKLLSINNGDEASNRFRAICINNGNILFANNGRGIFEIAGDDLLQYKLKNDDFNVVNSIMALNDDYIIATDFGIARFFPDNENYKETVLLNNIAVKDVLQGNWGNCWLSTDNGLAVYHPDKKTFHLFDHSYGIAITEYIPGTSFKDEQDDLIFFGGINGFTTIKYNDYDEAMDYMPILCAEKLSLYGVDRNIDDFVKNDPFKLILKSDENFFTITFSALDFLNGNNYTYYYKIGEKGQWIDNGNSRIVSFTDLAPGSYALYVKYYNKILEKESYTQKLSIRVLPPWHRSSLAYIIYSVLVISIGCLLLSSMWKRRRRQKKEEMLKAEQRRKEEIYEAKLDFFTDIAHEFCTPLTLIYGPCSCIMEQKNVSPSILKYASVISQNARRMNSLIGDLMDFKQIESGYKQPRITPLNVSEIADKIIGSFKIDSSGSMISIKKSYYASIVWNSDEKFLMTIMTNLVSNALKYSEKEGIVKVAMIQETENLKIIVSNKGKGIRKEDIDSIFNRYAILNNLEKQFGWQQNGLGLAVTAGMVKLLHGVIDVKSIPNETTTFTITLPAMQVSTTTNVQNYQKIDTDINSLIVPVTRYEYKDDRPTVTVIDDDSEMLWFICDLLNSEFNIIPVNDPMQATEVLGRNHTDIILCDVMMQSLDGVALTRMLKSDKTTSHIPLIIVSAVHEIEKQMEAIDAGAEMYVTKPFNPDYLKTTIRRLLVRKENLKDYFASPLSAFELNMGKLQHSEHKKFVKKIYGIINKNIQKKDLSPDFVAAELGISTRSLYRKLKEATDTGLLEMIHEGRLTLAENLLLKSKLTIDEIVFKSGFANRAGFYRTFSKKYGCTPTEFKERNM